MPACKNPAYEMYACKRCMHFKGCKGVHFLLAHISYGRLRYAGVSYRRIPLLDERLTSMHLTGGHLTGRHLAGGYLTRGAPHSGHLPSKYPFQAASLISKSSPERAPNCDSLPKTVVRKLSGARDGSGHEVEHGPHRIYAR
jgi:hypothetical protein